MTLAKAASLALSLGMWETATFIVSASATKSYATSLTYLAIILYNDKEHKLAEDLVHRMVKRAIEMEGTATGEHGVGLVKRDYLEHEVGVNAVDLMRKVSAACEACFEGLRVNLC